MMDILLWVLLIVVGLISLITIFYVIEGTLNRRAWRKAGKNMAKEHLRYLDKVV